MKPPNQHPLHVHLGFNLYTDRKQNNPTEAELEQIMAVFPTCYAATLMNPLLILHYETLPPRPWPLTIAGLPVYLTTELKLSPLPLGLPAGGYPLEIGATVCLWKTPTVDAMMEIFQGFDARKLPIKAIRWFGVRFLVEVEGEPSQNWRSIFPHRINKVQVSYIFGENMGTPGSLRFKLPTDAEPDDANHSNNLRPGVILSSGIGPDGFEVRTTSGVCVESPSGIKYFTCASHGFPLGLEDVYHPNAGGAIVGRVSKTLWDSEVSLILPSQGFQYSQEPFSSADHQSSPFSSLKHPFELCIGDSLHMDTPFNGHCEGIVVAVRMMRLPSDEPVTAHRYVFGTFDYIGNGSAQPLDECCGGVVWTEEFEPIGQFRYLDKGDCTAYITSFEHLIDLGYKLSNIEEDTSRTLSVGNQG